MQTNRNHFCGSGLRIPDALKVNRIFFFGHFRLCVPNERDPIDIIYSRICEFGAY